MHSRLSRSLAIASRGSRGGCAPIVASSSMPRAKELLRCAPRGPEPRRSRRAVPEQRADVSDGLVLAAVDRAYRHGSEKGRDAPIWSITDHLAITKRTKAARREGLVCGWEPDHCPAQPRQSSHKHSRGWGARESGPPLIAPAERPHANCVDRGSAPCVIDQSGPLRLPQSFIGRGTSAHRIGCLGRTRIREIGTTVSAYRNSP